MKIGKYEITDGPNVYWWMVTATFILLSFGGMWHPLAWWVGVNIIVVPVCLWLQRDKEKIIK